MGTIWRSEALRIVVKGFSGGLFFFFFTWKWTTLHIKDLPIVFVPLKYAITKISRFTTVLSARVLVVLEHKLVKGKKTLHLNKLVSISFMKLSTSLKF